MREITDQDRADMQEIIAEMTTKDKLEPDELADAEEILAAIEGFGTLLRALIERSRRA